MKLSFLLFFNLLLSFTFAQCDCPNNIFNNNSKYKKPAISFTFKNNETINFCGYLYNDNIDSIKAGAFYVYGCDTSFNYGLYSETDMLNIEFKSDTLRITKLYSFYNIKTKKFGKWIPYSEKQFYSTKNNKISTKEIFKYKAPILLKSEILEKEKELDKIFENNDTLIKNINNSYEFIFTLFYCSINGSEKPKYYFENLNTIIDDDYFNNKVGGHPLEVYQFLLREIYPNIK